MIALLGESGCGKSSIERELVKVFGYEKILIHTTRPMRRDEEEGIDYHFCGDSEFGCRGAEGQYLSVSVYNGWRYGIPKMTDDDIAGNSVVVVTPRVLRELRVSNIKRLRTFYISVPRKDRLIKSLMRGDDIEEAYRRNLLELGQFDGVEKECDFAVSNQLDYTNMNYKYPALEFATIIDELYKSCKSN